MVFDRAKHVEALKSELVYVERAGVDEARATAIKAELKKYDRQPTRAAGDAPETAQGGPITGRGRSY